MNTILDEGSVALLDNRVSYDLVNNPADRERLIETVRDPIVGKELLSRSDLPDSALFYVACQGDRVPARALIQVAEHGNAEEATKSQAWLSAIRFHRQAAIVPLALSRHANASTLNEVIDGEIAHYQAGSKPSELGKQFLLGAAANPNTQPASLARLATVPDLRVRANVAANPHTPAKSLGVLSNDMAMEVRRAVASNPQIGLAIIRRLSGDIFDVRLRLVENAPALLAQPPDKIREPLRVLADDENRYIAGIAENHLATIERMELESVQALHVEVVPALKNHHQKEPRKVDAAGIDDAQAHIVHEVSPFTGSNRASTPDERDGATVDLREEMVEIEKTSRAQPGQYLTEFFQHLQENAGRKHISDQDEIDCELIFGFSLALFRTVEERILGNLATSTTITRVSVLNASEVPPPLPPPQGKMTFEPTEYQREAQVLIEELRKAVPQFIAAARAANAAGAAALPEQGVSSQENDMPLPALPSESTDNQLKA